MAKLTMEEVFDWLKEQSDEGFETIIALVRHARANDTSEPEKPQRRKRGPNKPKADPAGKDGSSEAV